MTGDCGPGAGLSPEAPCVGVGLLIVILGNNANTLGWDAEPVAAVDVAVEGVTLAAELGMRTDFLRSRAVAWDPYASEVGADEVKEEEIPLALPMRAVEGAETSGIAATVSVLVAGIVQVMADLLA